MYEKVLSQKENFKIRGNGICFGKIFLNKDLPTISLRNKFLSKITGRNIQKSFIINSTNFEYTTDVLFTAICRTDDNTIIKIEILFDNNHDKNKILAIYYTSKFIENCYKNNEIQLKNPDVYQIRFTNYRIFDDNKSVHDFLYSDDSDRKLKNVIKISFIELPKIQQLECVFC